MNYISFILYVITTAFTPGPNNLASLSNMAKSGFRKGMIFNLGLAASQFMCMSLCVLFCGALNDFVPKVQTPLKIVGALYILYLAYKTFTSSGTGEGKESKGTFAEGFMLNTFNVKYYLYCLVSLETYIFPFANGNYMIICLMALTLVVFAMISNLSWGLFGSAFRSFFDKHGRLANTILALLLVYCAVSLFL